MTTRKGKAYPIDFSRLMQANMQRMLWRPVAANLYVAYYKGTPDRGVLVGEASSTVPCGKQPEAL